MKLSEPLGIVGIGAVVNLWFNSRKFFSHWESHTNLVFLRVNRVNGTVIFGKISINWQ